MSTYLNIDRDAIIGSFTLKEINEDLAKRLTSITIELI